MTDRLALILGGIVIAAIALDLIANSGQALLFLVMKFSGLVDWMVFWR